jgi:hypothetical protein
MKHWTVLAIGAGALLVSVGAAIETPAIAAPSPCTRVTNIEAIIDDSGSMSVTDPNRLRVQAMDLLINALSPGTTLGAVEFGSEESFATPPRPGADPVFNPEPVGSNAAAMKTALDTDIQADNGSTDYNAAFNTARAANPGAEARIFLTDGGHDEGAYADAHVNPTPPQTPTYVIGFSPGLQDSEDQARLSQIAADTGGRNFPLPDSSALQSVMNQVETILTCQSAPRTFEDELAAGQAKTHSVAISPATGRLQITVSWPSAIDSFKVGGLRLISKRAAKEGARAHPSKLRVERSAGHTFIVLKVSGLSKGRLSFRVKATRVSSGATALVTTQVSKAATR